MLMSMRDERGRDGLAEIEPQGEYPLKGGNQFRNPLRQGPHGPDGNRRGGGVGKTGQQSGTMVALHDGVTVVHWRDVHFVCAERTSR